MPGDTTVTYWDIPSCSVRLRYRSRMNERQRPLEELWVDPIPAKAAPVKTAPAKKKG